jgi:hypothetical protein
MASHNQQASAIAPPLPPHEASLHPCPPRLPDAPAYRTWTTTDCAFPASIHHHKIHNSSRPGCTWRTAPQGCAALLHLVNSFGARFSGPTSTDEPAFPLFSHPWWGAV